MGKNLKMRVQCRRMIYNLSQHPKFKKKVGLSWNQGYRSYFSNIHGRYWNFLYVLKDIILN